MRFDAALDSGLFHVFNDGATLHVLCFSEHEPAWGGPRRVTQKEIVTTFRKPFFVEDIKPARYATTLSNDGAQAWLARIAYIGRVVSTGN